ncbi:uncharacterized protein CcaverHIS019_0410630 [Cutaneotrichosporon cavernicola]|uniref:Zn(2)-C6 fungal-type domain-containing protein n=1 Tax=Cutaneotrichosporon cavernicola TaxID=279322 RepID=A0AA48L5D2_9TREE|nr:uncharacterized protein CcaverHIS019_0410630 [Cutaneotrichosporon cavernicola]BEI92243.1 hypothetical protein CcaverHIS019_0410630 [Cutaneotrichosporon cavernicola]BEJ00015.1 hypothetical protein CcaverHIS631_0410570 [Cutaneotrichosporon cavernicola]
MPSAPPPPSMTSSATDAVRPYTYKKRPYAQACLACKARKIRCVEADNPPCKACRTARIPCEFPERSVRRRRSAAAPTAPSASDAESAAGVIERRLERRLQRIEEALRLSPPRRVRRSSVKSDGEGEGDGEGDDGSSSEEELEPPRFTLGAAELPVYHGETSMHEDAVIDPSPKTSSSAPTNKPSVDASQWTHEDIRALTRLRHKYAAADEGEALMDAYFTWASPSTAVVNRRLFLRDMAVNGPYFSDLLLLVMYRSGLRFSPNLTEQERTIRSERYMNLILQMIAEELSKPSSIVTTQALLSLAGTQSARGEHTQAWMFTGMAIRMIQDLGIHLAIEEPSLDANMDQETREVRVRLYWSAYCWDKSISLAMGREPALTIWSYASPPAVLLNESDDDWEWRPFFPGGGNLDLVLRYPRTTSMTNYVLKYYVVLNQILEEILINMYSPHRPQARSVTFIRNADEKLKKWWDELPPAIKLDKARLPEFCPPTNITLLNLLYHCARILLYRPLLTVRAQPAGATRSLEVCRGEAIEIHAILSLWGRTYGNINMVYLIMYTTFVAAGVDVILLRIGDERTREEALERVHLSLSILEQVSGQGPGIRRGISIIASQLQATMQRHFAPSNGTGFAESAVRNKAHDTTPMTQPQTIDALTGPGFHDPLAPIAFQSPALFDDPQALADLLGESNVCTDDPFAFLTADGWDEMRLAA